MSDIFLSASVPLPNRDRRFFDTADVLAIRESIKALVEVVVPTGTLTCGGHPAVTPLLALFVREAELDRHRVTIFQSRFFEDQFPPEILEFVDIRFTPKVPGNREASLTKMRKEMISSRDFAAAVFIGGMEGTLEEYDIFVKYHPRATVLPVASTGAAADIIFRRGAFDYQLKRNLTFPSLFRHRLPLGQPRR